MLRLIRICRIRWWSSLFLFLTGNTLFGQIRPKKIKIVNLSWNFVDSLIQICRIQWCCSIFSFSTEIPFLRKFGPENKNYQFKMKFVTQTKLNMQKSVVLYTFFDVGWKFNFWENLVHKVKIVSLRWNLTLIRIIRICRNQWRCLLFLF